MKRVLLFAFLVVFALLSCTSDKKDKETFVCIDIEGNSYTTVRIGEQVWMGENLKTRFFRDSTAIQNVTEGSDWEALHVSAYCDYNNDSTNSDIYGRLYNWFAVDSPYMLCPEGWRVPTDDDWTTLTDYLGGGDIAGAKLKEEGTDHWTAPNSGATNESGFTALPGGYRSSNGNFYGIGASTDYWSSTSASATTAWRRYIYYNGLDISRFHLSKRSGFSVRCIMEED